MRANDGGLGRPGEGLGYEGGYDAAEGGRGGSDQMCREVDFLFVIDNSGSMSEYQNQVVANYDMFIDGIEEAIDTIETIHVGVITAEP